MIAIFCGSRDWTDAEAIRKVIYSIDELTMIHGAQRGADTIAGDLAVEAGIPVIPVPADWDAYGNAAGPIRNEYMKNMLIQSSIKYSQSVRCYAFHEDPKLGRGTRDMVRRARRANIRCSVYLSSSPEMIRVGGDVECQDCGLIYEKHPDVISDLDFNGEPFLKLSCSGELYKT